MTGRSQLETGARQRFCARRACLLAGAGLVLFALTGCRPDPASFYDEVHECRPDQPADDCGTDRDGRGMACFADTPAGARPFCAPLCSPAAPPGAGRACVSGHSLTTCRPSLDANEPGKACGQQGLSCYRTDLLADQGVCVVGQVCSEDSQCGGGGRVCATTLARAMFGASAPTKLDNLHCVQAGCAQRELPCPAGEVCLPSVIPKESAPPDICVPRCRGPNLECPPNHFCLRKVSGAHQPDVCLPGMPSFRCTSDLDCLLGECVDTGEGFSVCSSRCTSDADCTSIGSLREEMHCTLPGPGGARYCARVGAFDGTFCKNETDCAQGELCTRARPKDSLLCRPACGPGRACRDRGGMPQSCIDWFGPPVCHPAVFGTPCSTDRRCIGLLECLTGTVMDGQDQPRSQPICSRRCRVNEDCLDDATLGRLGGWCEKGVCTPRKFSGQRCKADVECESGACLPPSEGERPDGDLRCASSKFR